MLYILRFYLPNPSFLMPCNKLKIITTINLKKNNKKGLNLNNKHFW